MHTKFGKDWQRNLEIDAENVKWLQLMCYHGQKQRDTCRSSDWIRWPNKTYSMVNNSPLSKLSTDQQQNNNF